MSGSFGQIVEQLKRLYMIHVPVLLAMAMSLLTILSIREPGDAKRYLDFIVGGLGFFVWALAQLFRRMYFREEARSANPSSIMSNGNDTINLAISGSVLTLLLVGYFILLADGSHGREVEGLLPSFAGNRFLVSFAPVFVFNQLSGKKL